MDTHPTENHNNGSTEDKKDNAGKVGASKVIRIGCHATKGAQQYYVVEEKRQHTSRQADTSSPRDEVDGTSDEGEKLSLFGDHFTQAAGDQDTNDATKGSHADAGEGNRRIICGKCCIISASKNFRIKLGLGRDQGETIDWNGGQDCGPRKGNKGACKRKSGEGGKKRQREFRLTNKKLTARLPGP